MPSELHNVSDDIMTTKQAAAFLQMSAYQLGELARAGKVPYAQPIRQYRFSKRALLEWLSRTGISVDEAVGSSVTVIIPSRVPTPHIVPPRPIHECIAEINAITDQALRRGGSHG